MDIIVYITYTVRKGRVYSKLAMSLSVHKVRLNPYYIQHGWARIDASWNSALESVLYKGFVWAATGYMCW